MRDVVAGLSSAGILQAWEDGRDKHPLDRALHVLRAGDPSVSWEDLARLPIGRRDARRCSRCGRRPFGDRLRFAASCPRCAERVESEVGTHALLTMGSTRIPPGAAGTVEAGGTTVRYRLPDSRDLAAVAHLESEEASLALLRRCALDEDLPEGALPALDRALAEADPQADPSFDLRCPACGHRWDALLDVASFFWAELDVEARRVLLEVHVLARAYGWREADVLALSAARRRCYLDMVGA